MITQARGHAQLYITSEHLGISGEVVRRNLYLPGMLSYAGNWRVSEPIGMNRVEMGACGKKGRKRKKWKKNGSGSSAGNFWEFAGSEARDFSRYEIFSTSSPFRGRVYIWGHLLRWENFPWSPLRGMKFFSGNWLVLGKFFPGADSCDKKFYRELVPAIKNFYRS